MYTSTVIQGRLDLLHAPLIYRAEGDTNEGTGTEHPVDGDTNEGTGTEHPVDGDTNEGTGTEHPVDGDDEGVRSN